MHDVSQHYTILFVDDHQELLDTYADLLHDLAGFIVFTAHDGIEGLEQYEKVHPDCVVIDVRMPHLDGYQFVRALRGDPASLHTPLIILSALNQDADQLSGMLAGADRYLTKPVLPSELIATIQQAMAMTQNERQQHLQRLAEEQQ